MMALQDKEKQKSLSKRSQSMSLKVSSSGGSPRGILAESTVAVPTIVLDEESVAIAQAEAEEKAATVKRRLAAVDEEEFDLLHTFRVNSIRDDYLHPESQHSSVFDSQPSQPLFDREVVELFVRAATEWYLRAKLDLKEDAVSPEMSLTQVLYYVLARKLLPLTSSNFEATIPVFYNYFYHEDIQGLLTQNPFFQKLWQHLLSTIDATADYSSIAAAESSTIPPATLFGHSLGPMHSAAATEYNIHDVEGGFTRVGQLLQFLTTR